LYFNYTTQGSKGYSDIFYGKLNPSDGIIQHRADLGGQFDPKGELVMSTDGSTFAFGADSIQGVKEHFGCCDKTAVMSVDTKTGKNKLSEMHRFGEISGTSCGIWGCGLMTLNNFDAKSNTVMAWVEELLPPPPPTAPKVGATTKRHSSSHSRRLLGGKGDKPNPLGKALVELNLGTMKATTIAPFSFDLNDATGPVPVSGFGPAYDSKENVWYHAVNPISTNFELEGICAVNVIKSQKPLTKKVYPWKNMPSNYTITSIQYSEALSEVVFLAQGVSDPSALSPSKLFTFNPKTHKYSALVDLGMAWNDLHQTTMSSDGRFMFATLQTGNQNKPTFKTVTVDVVTQKVIHNVAPKDNKNIAVLSTLAC